MENIKIDNTKNIVEYIKEKTIFKEVKEQADIILNKLEHKRHKGIDKKLNALKDEMALEHDLFELANKIN